MSVNITVFRIRSSARSLGFAYELHDRMDYVGDDAEGGVWPRTAA
jgi:hypothetical protein